MTDFLSVLMLAQFGMAAMIGPVAIVFPHFFEVFFYNNPSAQDSNLLHVIIQMYGSLILGQSILVYFLREYFVNAPASPHLTQLRTGVVSAYFTMFFLSFLFVLRGHWLAQFNGIAAINTVLFFNLAFGYGVLLLDILRRKPDRRPAL